MALLSPLFLLGALTALVPLVLHLLKRHPEAVVRFSAVRLLRAAPVEHASRRHLRELLLLALRVGALVLLAVAFARPFLAAADAVRGSALVIAVDTSFSMSGAGRVERARAFAAEAIDSAPSGTPIAVVTFDDRARTASALSSDRALARAAVDAAVPSFGATHYAAAVSLAAELLKGRSGRLVIVTDLQARGWDATAHPELPAAVSLKVADIGVPAANLAVTSAHVAGEQLAATVLNAAATPADAHLRLGAGKDGSLSSATPAGELRVPIDAGQSVEVTWPRPSGRWASISVDDTDGPPADNARYVVLDGTSQSRVLLVTTTGELAHGAFYLEQALTARGRLTESSYDAEGVAASALQGWDRARVETHAAVILTSTRGLEHRGRELIRQFVASGGGLLVPIGPDVDGDVLSELLSGAAVTALPADGRSRGVRTLASTDRRHPVLRPFVGPASLGLVRFEQVATIRASGCEPLARFSGGETALVECEAGLGRALLFASDFDNRGNDFPRHATFLPFIHEAIRYLAATRPSADYLIGAVPEGVPPAPGIAVRGAGAQQALIAVNVDAAESDPARLTVEEFDHAVVRTGETPAAAPKQAAREQEAQQHLWQYVLACVLCLVALESVVASRAA